MKSNNLEEEFVKKFIIKNKQERILWELRSSKKRESVFWRFAGTEILKKECLNDLGYMPQKELEGYLLKYVRSRCVYFIGNDYIGEISLEEAVAQMEMGSIGIIYCGDGIGYYQGEQEINGHTPRCLLKENNVQM